MFLIIACIAIIICGLGAVAIIFIFEPEQFLYHILVFLMILCGFTVAILINFVQF